MKKAGIVTALLCIGALMYSMLSCKADKKENKSYAAPVNANYLDFPSELSPGTPYDVDTAVENPLLRADKIVEAQRLFDILSWQMFISLNWPLDKSGKPMAQITDTGTRSWESWKESFEIFKEDGSTPLPWGSNTEIPIDFKDKVKDTGKEDILYRTSKFATFNKNTIKKNKWVKKFVGRADEINQAFTAPIWDQNGNILRYEIRINKIDADYIIQNELYNIDGQIAFSKAGKKVNFPVGTRNKAGVMELKFAWKIIDPDKDFPERYFTKQALVLMPNGSFEEKLVGLVGMHIATKTVSSPQWIWATFEHVDNLETNELTLIHGKPLKPSFYDPACSTCPVNLLPDTTHKPIKNQVQRILPIPMATQALNQQVQTLLRQKNSFWQYYQLIGTQWPTRPGAAPYPVDTTVYNLPEAVTNKSGGFPVPVYLTNMVMETYFQGGTIVGHDSIPSEFNKFLANEPAYFQIEGSPKDKDKANTNKIIFGTEGCVGCHHSAGVAYAEQMVNGMRQVKYAAPGSADFEWLLQLKAQFKTKQ